MTTDPLSDVLSYLKPQSYVAGGFDLGGDWSVQFEEHKGIKYFALASGKCWLAVEGEAAPILLEADDCVLLPSGRRFTMARDLSAEPTSIREIPESEWWNGIATLNGGGDTLILGGHFAFSGDQADLLLGAMPPILRLRNQDDRDGIRWALERMRVELTTDRPGGNLVVQHLAHLMLVQALRLYLGHGAGQGVGWLFALNDPQIAAALRAIHAHPGTRWNLPRLAGAAGMSRSKFALKFKSLVGSSPMDYVMRWRMLVACDRLTRGAESIATIAFSLGYESDAAFSTAFKRVVGYPPRRYAERG